MTRTFLFALSAILYVIFYAVSNDTRGEALVIPDEAT